MGEDRTGPQVHSSILSLDFGNGESLTRRMGAAGDGGSAENGEEKSRACRFHGAAAWVDAVQGPRSPNPSALWPGTPTWLGREPALTGGSEGGERLLSPTPGSTGALRRGAQGDLQPRELSSINLAVPLT